MPEFFGQLPLLEQPWTMLGAVTAVESLPQGILLRCDSALLSIQILAPNLVHVRLAPKAPLRPRRSWEVTQPDEAWPASHWDLKEQGDALELQTDRLSVHVEKTPCRVSFCDRDGRAFAQDTDFGMGWRTGAIAAWKHLHPEEHFFGLGERCSNLDQRGDRRTHWTFDSLDYTVLTDEMYQAIPFFVSLRPGLGYGLFFNTTYRSYFDLGASEIQQWSMETQGPELDYYLIYGPTPAQILQTYSELTGRIPLPPSWALGYHQSRWSYGSDAEVQQLAKEFRRRHIPCDVIHLDIDYMQGFRVFTWHKQRFANPTRLLNDLRDNGFRVVTIVDPGIKYDPEASYQALDEALERDYLVRDRAGKVFHGYVWPDRAVFPDFLRPEVRQWWGQLQGALTQAGVAGIWNDMNEPAMNDRPFGDPGQKVWFPEDAPQGPPEEQGTHAETHNLYGLMMARASAEGLAQLRPQERSFVLTRSGFAGVQRWSAVWTGDNHSRWEYLELSLPMLMNLGLSGVPFVGADIGGFAGNASPELFARWMQMGMLYPLMRGHSMIGTHRHEPWSFGDRVENICRRYIELRYRLMPYLYTLFWEAATTGAPILRPLLYHFPDNPKTYSINDQAMLGPSIMAAPVCRAGVECRTVYLPEGIWYNWWNGQRYVGPGYFLADAPLEVLPLYVRAGAVVPLGPVMQHTDERPLDELRLRVWPGHGTWTLYEDDGRSLGPDLPWATTTYRVSQTRGDVVVEIAPRTGIWRPPTRDLIVEVVGLGEQRLVDDGQGQRLVF